MPRVFNSRIRFVVWIGLGLVFAFALLISISNFEYVVSDSLSKDYIDEQVDAVGVEIRMQEVDVDSGVLRFLVKPEAFGIYGDNLENGAFLKYPLLFNFDVLSGESLHDPSAGNIFGGQSVGVQLIGSQDTYPFDKYRANFFASAQLKSSSEATLQTPQLLASDSAKAISGFTITAEQVGFIDGERTELSIQNDRDAGVAFIVWEIERSESTKFIALLLSSLMILGGVMGLFITFSIINQKRPPSVTILVWLAAFLFALFQVRSQFPGSPPVGIALDKFVFFPTVLTLVVLIVVNVLLWVWRDDWDLENPLTAIRGKISK